MKIILIAAAICIVMNLISFVVGTRYTIIFDIEAKNEQIAIDESPREFSGMTQDEAEFVKGFDAKPIDEPK